MPTQRAFDSLPGDWARRPMTDADLVEGVIDLVVRDRDRTRGAIVLLLCHADGRLMEPLVLNEVTAGADLERVESVVGSVLDLQRAIGAPGVVVVIARPGEATPTARDVRVGELVRGLCSPPLPALLGMAVATPEGVRLLPRGSATEAA